MMAEAIYTSRRLSPPFYSYHLNNCSRRLGNSTEEGVGAPKGYKERRGRKVPILVQYGKKAIIHNKLFTWHLEYYLRLTQAI